MLTQLSIVDPRWLRRLTSLLGLCTLIAGAISFSGWVFDCQRLTDWLNDGLSIQPNTTVLIMVAGAAVLLLQYGCKRCALVLGGFVALGGGLNLLQYAFDIDLGFNHLLLFGREWGYGGTMAPGRFGPPASISFVFIGIALMLLGARDNSSRRLVPVLALIVVLLTMFSLLGYLFGAHDFYAIPWLSAIALPSATMLLALAVSLIMSVPQHHPMLLLCERSSAGSMARTVLPILIVMIPLFIWLRTKGHELGLFDIGTSRALGAAMLILGVVALMWNALLALRRREQREREADRRKDEFLATLAHELRNPLAPISNATSMLKLAHGDREISVRATNMIERQLTHMVRLIDDLLDLSRISRGKLELRRERIELAAVIYQAIETCSPMAESANQKIIVTIPPQPIYLDADSVRLSQVVSNLLNNACKFAGQGGVINLSVVTAGADVVIAVKDNGIGIPSAMLGSIFEMFAQVDQSLERSQSGLGIGLTLAKRLVELHDGSIEARSEGLGKGSELVVRLPITADQAPPLEAVKRAGQQSISHRILIVDDNLDGAESLAEVFRLSGNETFVAHDGEAAVDAAETYRPDVILLDIGMPKLNGFDACRRIRAKSWAEKTLIIATTGWGQDEDRRKSAEAGFDSHFVKPVDLAELMTLLASLSPAGGAK
ncbi:MAG: ATP-binding protein [Cellvibrio sp.]|uniref:hybrid sensor histidine kinase/response regulator n=1 Tax=Cellvibrio sp. TaxID=1965322 RepID=UPI0031A06814